jgi:hypothetical protein
MATSHRRHRRLTAALDLFSTTGYDLTTAHDMAGAVGVQQNGAVAFVELPPRALTDWWRLRFRLRGGSVGFRLAPGAWRP